MANFLEETEEQKRKQAIADELVNSQVANPYTAEAPPEAPVELPVLSPEEQILQEYKAQQVEYGKKVEEGRKKDRYIDIINSLGKGAANYMAGTMGTQTGIPVKMDPIDVSAFKGAGKDAASDRKTATEDLFREYALTKDKTTRETKASDKKASADYRDKEDKRKAGERKVDLGFKERAELRGESERSEDIGFKERAEKRGESERAEDIGFKERAEKRGESTRAEDIGFREKQFEYGKEKDTAASAEKKRQFDAEQLLENLKLTKDKAAGKDLTPGQKKADQVFATGYVEFNARGGYADVEKGLKQLDEVSKTLGNRGDITGGFTGLTPKPIRDIIAPVSADMQDNVEEVVQRNLRLILGAQFTRDEGIRLIERAYNPRLSEAINKKRIDRLRDQIRTAAKSKQKAGEYFEKNGTLKGFKTSGFSSPNDFLKEYTLKPNEVRRVTKDGKSAVFNSDTKKFIRYED